MNLHAKLRKLGSILATPAWQRALLIHGVAAATEHARLLCSLGDVRLVVDIGANRGQFALVARRCFPKARIVAFEPLPEPASTFVTVFRNDRLVRLHDVAIGPYAAETVMHLSDQDDSSSLLPTTAMQNTVFPGTATTGTTRVRVTRLTHWLAVEMIETPALLKLDVQGFELQALIGCEDLLERFRWVYAECSFVELYASQALADSVIVWLHERGFALRGVYNLAYSWDGRAVQGDLLFSKR